MTACPSCGFNLTNHLAQANTELDRLRTVVAAANQTVAEAEASIIEHKRRLLTAEATIESLKESAKSWEKATAYQQGEVAVLREALGKTLVFLDWFDVNSGAPDDQDEEHCLRCNAKSGKTGGDLQHTDWCEIPEIGKLLSPTTLAAAVAERAQEHEDASKWRVLLKQYDESPSVVEAGLLQGNSPDPNILQQVADYEAAKAVVARVQARIDVLKSRISEPEPGRFVSNNIGDFEELSVLHRLLAPAANEGGGK